MLHKEYIDSAYLLVLKTAPEHPALLFGFIFGLN